jgi:hypothetical protein
MPFAPPPLDPFKSARVNQFTIEHAIDGLGSRAETVKLRLARGVPQERTLCGFVLPFFQRGAVWTRAQCVRFVESAWQGVDLGRYVVNAPNNSDYLTELDDLLLDGQQRLTALRDYVDGAFEVFGAVFADVPEVQRARFLRLLFPMVTTHLDKREDAEALYHLLNFGGVPHHAARTVPALRAALDAATRAGDRALAAQIGEALNEWDADAAKPDIAALEANREQPSFVCDGCGWMGEADELREIRAADLSAYAGASIPAGGCPQCGTWLDAAKAGVA